MAEEELRDSSERAFQANGEPLETVTSFKYLGHVMTTGDDDWTTVAGNLRRYHKSWTHMNMILVEEGADPKISGLFFKAFVQVVILFGSEMWVLNPRMERALRIFQHRVVRQITGRQKRRQDEGGMGLSHAGGSNEGGEF